MKTLAERLIEEREARGLSQPELAAKAKISQSFIGALETGRQKSSAWLPEIAYALGLHAMWLKTGIGPKEINSTGLSAQESRADYPVNVTTLPTDNPLKRELMAVCDRMSERGIQILIYEAERIDRLYPRAQPNHSS